MICRRCNQEKEPHKTSPHLCIDCVKAENNRVSFLRTQNADWTEIAAEADIDLWERQPAETDYEWSVWLRYRDAYPGKRPSYRGVSEELNTSVDAVKKVGNRWTFPARLQAWSRFMDNKILLKRQEEILTMNQHHVDMAVRLNSKISTAIDNIDPYEVSAKEIGSLIKTATELERKGRLDQVVPGTGIAHTDVNTELKDTEVKDTEVEEILKILGKAGVLGNFGVRQTTTEVVVKGDDA